MMQLRAESDFSFDSRNNSPYDSAPQSPQGFNNYFFSAPASPYNHQNSFSFTPDQHILYDYHHACDEEKYDEEKPFAFIHGADLDLVRPGSSADEVFNGEKIKPCEPKRKNIIKKTLSFGRDTKVCSQGFEIPEETVKDSSSSSSSSSSFGWLYKKLRLKDFLFRNASEGHETNNKYDFLRKFKNDELKNSSSSSSRGSTNSVSSGKKKNKERATLSAHEKHYKVNRAAAEEMKKKTYLPYKQNLMIGCVNHDAVSVRDPSRATLKIR